MQENPQLPSPIVNVFFKISGVTVSVATVQLLYSLKTNSLDISKLCERQSSTYPWITQCIATTKLVDVMLPVYKEKVKYIRTD